MLILALLVGLLPLTVPGSFKALLVVIPFVALLGVAMGLLCLVIGALGSVFSQAGEARAWYRVGLSLVAFNVVLLVPFVLFDF